MLDTSWLIPGISITLAFSTVYVWGAELFPTDVRAFAYGFSNLFARAGGMLAPVLAAASGANAIFAALALLGCAVSLQLVETRGVSLPATLYGGEDDASACAKPAGIELSQNAEDARVRDALLGSGVA